MMKHKMKTSLLLLFTVFFIHPSFCQEFATNDSEWVYDYNGFWAHGVISFSYKQDTLIGNRQVKVFKQYVTGVMRGTTDTSSREFQPVLFAVQNGIVEFSLDTINFDTLYNFQAPIGKSWQLPWGARFSNNYQHQDSLTVTIVDTFRTLISGKNVLSQAVSYQGLADITPYTKYDTIYEQIGSKWFFLLPQDDNGLIQDGAMGESFRCFANAELGLVQLENAIYPRDYMYDCNQIALSSEKEIPLFRVKVYPNPALDKLLIESEESSKIHLDIVDMQGKIIKQTSISFGKKEVDISALSSGIYLIRAEGRALGRLIKE